MTRLPLPSVPFEPDWLPRAAKYFPAIGIGIGLFSGAVLLVAARLWPQPIPAVLAIAAGLLLTGALHEDGLADAADSLGGRTREQRLAIMKDSRLGSYGALALLVCLGLQAASLAVLPALSAAAALVGAHAGGRLAAVLVMAAQSYAGDRAAAKVEHAEDRPSRREQVVALVFGLAPLFLLGPGPAVAAALLAAGAGALAAFRLCRVLRGYTGDVLGAVIAMTQTAFLLGAAIR
jgi:adenosylcobinamide-GDP ribazoletransferase